MGATVEVVCNVGRAMLSVETLFFSAVVVFISPPCLCFSSTLHLAEQSALSLFARIFFFFLYSDFFIFSLMGFLNTKLRTTHEFGSSNNKSVNYSSVS